MKLRFSGIHHQTSRPLDPSRITFGFERGARADHCAVAGRDGRAHTRSTILDLVESVGLRIHDDHGLARDA